VTDDRLVSTVDVVATLLDVAGAEPLPESPGRSLAPLLLEGGPFERDRIYGGMTELRNEKWMPDGSAGRAVKSEKAWYIRTDRFRLIWWPERKRTVVYRIDQDPLEQDETARFFPRERSSLLRELSAWVERNGSPDAPGPPEEPSGS
jgi:arylsulfatase A-like enzyme